MSPACRRFSFLQPASPDPGSLRDTLSCYNLQEAETWPTSPPFSVLQLSHFRDYTHLVQCRYYKNQEKPEVAIQSIVENLLVHMQKP
jgi:hypothetical protein